MSDIPTEKTIVHVNEAYKFLTDALDNLQEAERCTTDPYSRTPGDYPDIRHAMTKIHSAQRGLDDIQKKFMMAKV